MRLLEGEVRAASIMASAPGARWSTQASNFSWRRRSAALAETSTVSMPNWRKHSVSRAREDSLRSTRAARAAAFLVGRTGAGAVPKAFSMSGAGLSPKLYCGAAGARWKDPKGQDWEYKRA